MTTLVLEQSLMGLKSKATRVNERANNASHLTANNWKRVLYVVMLPTVWGLYDVGRLLDGLINALNSPEIDQIPENEVKQIANELFQVHKKLNKCLDTYTHAGLRQLFLYRPLLDRFESGSSHLLSIIEGLHISANKEFVAEIAASAEELRSLKDSKDCSERRTLVGKV